MAQRSTSNVVAKESPAAGARRQTGEAGNDAALTGTPTMFTDAHDLQIVNSTLSVAGRDINNHVHNHYHSGGKRDIWAILHSVPNFRDIYHDMLEKATPGTGIWLIKGDKFRVWLEPNGDIRIFWGSGIPGAGKTVVASIVIEHLEALRTNSGGAICVCYVYFRYSQREAVTVRNVLETIVKQTLERHPECQALIQRTYAQHIREGSEPTVAQLLALLRELADHMACTFYVLDALDEAPVKIQLAVVKTLASLNVKLFITSRPLETVQAKFPQAHTITITAQDADLDLHIAKEIDESADLQYLLDQEDPSLREEIVSTIKQNCGGMFLHASLQLDALCECVSAQQVRRTLKGFPSRIEDVYLQTWDRILKQNVEHVLLAKAVLLWVLYASRSMTVQELGRAVATSPHTYKFEADRVVPITTLISLCRGLVKVEEDSHLVRLVHYTAKDTLQGVLHKLLPHPHSLLAAVCMTHLAECGFQNTTVTSEDEFKAVLMEDPLLAYASEAWAFHARAGLDVDETKHRTAQFLNKSHAFPAFTGHGRTWYFDILSPLHILGLYKLPMTLVEGAITGDPNSTTAVHRQTPLIVASRSGHKDLVAHLIATPETQVNSVDGSGSSALIWAARAGQEGVVKLFLMCPETQVNLGDKYGGSALTRATRSGHEGVVKLLLAYPGIQVNLRDVVGRSALAWAAIFGREGIAKLLLAYPGIQVNLVDNDGCSALMRAAYAGQDGVLGILLAYPGTQVNLVDNNRQSALIVAAHGGQEVVVRLLLAFPGIQVNVVDSNRQSALIVAAYAGRKVIVKLLLAHPEIQVNMRSNNGWTALMQAVYAGQEGVVEVLLACPGIQVNLGNDYGQSALMVAAYAGKEGAVRLLLSHPRIQVNFRDNNGYTALLGAAYYGHQPVVELLLATDDVDVNACDRVGNTAIKMAAQGGHEAVVRILLDTPHIDITIRSTADGHTAMSAAQANGHSGIVELLEDFESRQLGASPPKIDQLSLYDMDHEEGSDSGSDEAFYDAEEEAEVDITLSSPIPG